MKKHGLVIGCVLSVAVVGSFFVYGNAQISKVMNIPIEVKKKSGDIKYFENEKINYKTYKSNYSEQSMILDKDGIKKGDIVPFDFKLNKNQYQLKNKDLFRGPDIIHHQDKPEENEKYIVNATYKTEKDEYIPILKYKNKDTKKVETIKLNNGNENLFDIIGYKLYGDKCIIVAQSYLDNTNETRVIKVDLTTNSIEKNEFQISKKTHTPITNFTIANGKLIMVVRADNVSDNKNKVSDEQKKSVDELKNYPIFTYDLQTNEVQNQKVNLGMDIHDLTIKENKDSLLFIKRELDEVTIVNKNNLNDVKTVKLAESAHHLNVINDIKVENNKIYMLAYNDTGNIYKNFNFLVFDQTNGKLLYRAVIKDKDSNGDTITLNPLYFKFN